MTKDVVMMLLVNAAVFTVLFGLMLVVRRFIGKRISAVMQYVLWAVVVIKLIIPFGFESSLSPFGLFSEDNNRGIAEQTDYEAVSGLNENYYSGAVLRNDYSAHVQDSPSMDTDNYTEQSLQNDSVSYANVDAAHKANSFDWSLLALLAWGAGALAVIAVQFASLANLRKRVRHSKLPVFEDVARIFESCRQELKITRHIEVVEQSALDVPFVMGILSPVLVLPGDIESKSAEQIRHICLHELTHVKYGDLFAITLLNVLRAVYWFNPLVWVCFRFIRKDMETACDARVISHVGTAARQRYIGTVLQFTEHQEKQRLYAAMGMADGRLKMEQRILGMFKRQRTDAKGRIVAICIAVLILAMSVLTACQPTPEEAVVVNKKADLVEDVLAAVDEGGEKALDEDKEIIAEQIKQVNGHMDMVITPGDSVTIQVDADIVAPAYDQIPLVRVRPENLSAEKFETFADYLTGGLPLYVETWDGETGNSDSVEELTAQLSLIKSYLANDDLPKPEQNAWERRAEQMQEALKSAISEADEQPYDGTPIPAEDNRTFSSITSLKCYMGKAKAATLSLMQSFEGNDTQMMFFNSDGVSGYNMHEPYAGVDAPRIEMTYEEAKAKVMDFVHAMDGEDSNLVIYDSSIAYQIGTLPNYTMETSPQGYAFHFARCYNGVAVKPVDYLWGFSESIDYSKQVSPEMMRVTIDDSGIVDAIWSDYKVYIEDVAGDVPLMEFDAVQDIFEDYCRYKFAWTYRNDALVGDTTPDVTLNVKRIELNVMVIPEKDDLDSYITVPVWDFIADMTLEGDGMTQEGIADEGQQNVSILTINAINGTVIDRQQGY